MTSSTDPPRHPVLNLPGKCWRAFKRLTQLSFPKSYPIVQFPNAPLILAFVSGLLAQHSHGHEHDYAQAVSYLALAIWAYLELFHGCQRVPAVARAVRTRSQRSCTSRMRSTITEAVSFRGCGGSICV